MRIDPLGQEGMIHRTGKARAHGLAHHLLEVFIERHIGWLIGSWLERVFQMPNSGLSR
jgi:hypothetical protein